MNVCSDVDFFLLGPEQIFLGIPLVVDRIEELAVEENEDVRALHSLYHVAVAVQDHVEDSDQAQSHSKEHED